MDSLSLNTKEMILFSAIHTRKTTRDAYSQPASSADSAISEKRVSITIKLNDGGIPAECECMHLSAMKLPFHHLLSIALSVDKDKAKRYSSQSRFIFHISRSFGHIELGT